MGGGLDSRCVGCVYGADPIKIGLLDSFGDMMTEFSHEIK